MKTAHNAASELTTTLTKMGFVPARWDSPDFRQLQSLSKTGHPNLRVCIAFEGEPRPLEISLIKYNGDRRQITEWESGRMSARMPLKAILALIKDCL